MNEQKSVVLIAPRFTEATRTSRLIGLAFKDYFEEQGVNVLPLGHFRARRLPLLLKLKQQQRIEKPPHLVIYIGHGEYVQQRNSLIGGELLGSKLELFTLLNTKPFPVNQRIINNLVREPTIFFTIGCSTGKLGEYLTNRGLKSFIGTYYPTWVSQIDLDEDNVPDIIPIYLAVIQSLITGNPISAAIESMKFIARVYYNKAENLPESEDKQDILNTFASPTNYKLLGQDMKWVN